MLTVKVQHFGRKTIQASGNYSKLTIRINQLLLSRQK